MLKTLCLSLESPESRRLLTIVGIPASPASPQAFLKGLVDKVVNLSKLASMSVEDVLDSSSLLVDVKRQSRDR